jgi:hypothetical protein
MLSQLLTLNTYRRVVENCEGCGRTQVNRILKHCSRVSEETLDELHVSRYPRRPGHEATNHSSMTISQIQATIVVANDLAMIRSTLLLTLTNATNMSLQRGKTLKSQEDNHILKIYEYLTFRSPNCHTRDMHDYVYAPTTGQVPAV